MFILSDSPPEKDVQWSEEGINSSFKFIQKLWSLNIKIIEEINKNHQKNTDNEIEKYTNKFLKNITNNLENFSYNKLVANLHEMYSFISKQIAKTYKKNTLIDNYKMILIAITPMIPHFSNECLKMLNVKEVNWPTYDENILKEDVTNIVIQINGKKRGLIKTKINTSENDLLELIKEDEKLSKYIFKENIKRKIYIKNKLINIIL